MATFHNRLHGSASFVSPAPSRNQIGTQSDWPRTPPKFDFPSLLSLDDEFTPYRPFLDE